MKKYLFLFAVMAVTLTTPAQVAFLKVSDTYPDYGDEQPEQNAYNWFVEKYGAGNVIDKEHIPADASTYKVLWVNVEREISESDFDNNLFPDAVRTALSGYVKAGGNLLLTKKACRLACHIGRMGDRVGGTYYPTWGNSGYGVGGDVWTINAMIGVRDGLTLRDARQHPIFKDMTKGTYNEFTHESFPLIGKVNRSDNNIMWSDMERKDGTKSGNDDIASLNNFQSDWNCQVLAVWGHVVNYCAPTVIEFFPQGEYKGSVITIGAAAYQWGNSNDYISNVQKLTENSLAYLTLSGAEYGYALPYSLSEIYSIEEFRPDYEAAKWFYDNYVATGKGRFIHRDEVFPDGMKVLWVNNDRSDFTDRATFYTDLGGDAFKTRLEAFVKAGGNVFLSKQATRLAHDIGRVSSAPDYRMNGWQDNDANARYMTADFYALKQGETRTGLDRHMHPAYQYLPAEAWVTKNEGGNDVSCRWQLLDASATSDRRTDNNAIWENSNWDGYDGPVSLTRATKFEKDNVCRILGGYGHTTALDGVGFVEFYPYGAYTGTMMALGLCTYQWGLNNGLVERIQKLTKGVLEYLASGTDKYTRSVTNGNYGTICLPRAAESMTGATFYRTVGKILDGTTPTDVVIEEVSTLEAGIPYLFYATANLLRVNYTGGAVGEAGDANGLIGSFVKAPVANDANHYILSDNTLYPVNESWVGENRAWLDLSAMSVFDPDAPALAPRRHLALPHIRTATDNVTAESAQGTKILRDGQLLIIREGRTYNAQGQELR